MKTRAVKRGQSSGTSTATEARSFTSPPPSAAASSLQGSAASGAAEIAWTSRATPQIPKQSTRFGVTSSSSTGSASGSTSASGVPGAGSSSSTRMPSASSPSSSSETERIIPSEATPRSFALRSFSPPGIRAPGRATATVWPAATLGAPQTIVRSPSPSPVSTVQTRSRSASGCCSALEHPADDEALGRGRADGADPLDLGPGHHQPLGDLRHLDAGVAVLAQP